MVSQFDITHNLSPCQLQSLKVAFKDFKIKHNLSKMTFTQFCDGIIISLLKKYTTCLEV